jgi:hypothetical protein
MANFSNYTDEQLQQRLQELQGAGVIPTPPDPNQPRVVVPSPYTADPRIVVPPTPGRNPDLSGVSDADLEAAADAKKSLLQRAGEGTASALGEGALRMLGIPGGAEDLLRRGMFTAGSVVGGPTPTEKQYKDMRIFPTGDEIVQGWTEGTGTKFVKPSPGWGSVGYHAVEGVLPAGALTKAKSVGEAIINMLRYGIVPGAVGEGAGQGAEAMGADKGTADVVRSVATVATGGAASLTPPRLLKSAPTIERLTALGAKAMEGAKSAGFSISQSAVGRLIATVRSRSGVHPLAPEATPVATEMLTTLDRFAQQPSLSVDDLHALRKVLRTYASKAAGTNNAADERAIMAAKSGFDEWMKGLDQKDLAQGSVIVNGKVPDVKAATRAFKKGIDYFTRAGKAQELADIVDWSKVTAEASDAGVGSFAQVLRARLKVHVRDKNWIRMFTPVEQRALRRVASGGPMGQFLRTIGSGKQLGAGGIGRLGSAAVISHFTNPKLAGVIYGAGTFGRAASKALTSKQAQNADLLLRGGAGSVPGDPRLYGVPSALNWALSAPTPPDDQYK